MNKKLLSAYIASCVFSVCVAGISASLHNYIAAALWLFITAIDVKVLFNPKAARTADRFFDGLYVAFAIVNLICFFTELHAGKTSDAITSALVAECCVLWIVQGILNKSPRKQDV